MEWVVCCGPQRRVRHLTCQRSAQGACRAGQTMRLCQTMAPQKTQRRRAAGHQPPQGPRPLPDLRKSTQPDHHL